jgi:hypothetical protein
MYRKFILHAATAALCLVSLNSPAAQDFSALSTAELTKYKLEELGEEDLKSFRAEIQKRSMDLSKSETQESRSKQREQKKGQGRGQGKGGKQGGMGREY